MAVPSLENAVKNPWYYFSDCKAINLSLHSFPQKYKSFPSNLKCTLSLLGKYTSQKGSFTMTSSISAAVVEDNGSWEGEFWSIQDFNILKQRYITANKINNRMYTQQSFAHSHSDHLTDIAYPFLGEDVQFLDLYHKMVVLQNVFYASWDEEW